MFTSFISAARAQDLVIDEDVACPMTSISCPCTLQRPTGKCTRHQGDGTCLLSDCNEGYRCDCLGFEKCTVSPCSKFMLSAGAESEKKPFKCRMTPNAGTCTDFDAFLGTTAAADNAKYASAANFVEVALHEEGIEDIVRSIRNDRDEVHKTLQLVYEEERGDLIDAAKHKLAEDSALELLQLSAEVETLASMTAVDTAEAFKADMAVADFRRKAHNARKNKKEKLNKARVEKEKPENKDKCIACEKLEEEAKELDKERSSAAKSAAKSSKKSREYKNAAHSRRKDADDLNQKAKNVRKNAVDANMSIVDKQHGKKIK